MSADPVVRWLTDGEQQAQLRFAGPALVMVGGVTGAGKSTLLERLAPEQALILDADAYRGQVQREKGLSEHGFDADSIPEARRRFLRDLHSALQAGRNVVVDAALLKRKARAELINLAAQYSYHADLLLVCASLQECLQGVAARERSVPEAQVRRYWQLWERLLQQLKENQPDPGLRSVTVLDRAASHALRHICID